jgi:hypothetical protein
MLGCVADAIEGFEIDMNSQGVTSRDDVERDARGFALYSSLISEPQAKHASNLKGQHLWADNLIPLVDVKTRNSRLNARALNIANYRKVSEWRMVLGGRFLRLSGR